MSALPPAILASTDEQAGACTPPKPGCDADPRRSTPLHRGTAGA